MFVVLRLTRRVVALILHRADRLRRVAFAKPRCVWLRCVESRCVALGCVALCCVASRCVVLGCITLRCVVSRRAASRHVVSTMRQPTFCRVIVLLSRLHCVRHALALSCVDCLLRYVALVFEGVIFVASRYGLPRLSRRVGFAVVVCGSTCCDHPESPRNA